MCFLGGFGVLGVENVDSLMTRTLARGVTGGGDGLGVGLGWLFLVIAGCCSRKGAKEGDEDGYAETGKA